MYIFPKLNKNKRLGWFLHLVAYIGSVHFEDC